MAKRSGFRVMTRLIGLVRPLAGFMLLAIGLGVLGHLCAAFITILGGYALLSILGLDGAPSLTALFLALVAAALLRGFLRYGEQMSNHYIAFKLLALLRDRVFRALRRLCPAKLEGRDKGDLINLITSDIELLEVFYAHTISPVAIACLFSAIMTLFIGQFHWLLGLLALAAYLVVGALVPLITARLSGETGLHFRQRSGALASFILESLRGLDEVQQYGQGPQRLHTLAEQSDRLAADEKRLKDLAGRNQATTLSIVLLFDLAMLFLSAYLYRSGAVGIDGLLLPTLALFSSFGPCVALADLGASLQNTFAAGNRVLDILDETPVVDEIHGQPTIAYSGATVDAVSFAYGDETILRDVSLTLPRGCVVGLIGRSGSGKSTLLKLLMRFWQVQQGRIALSGTDIDAINTSNLRDLESYVTQDTHLFHDSIRSNLRIARLDATDAEIEAACRKAAIHDFIMSLPQGYDTPVGELGDTLSGGERQRLGLARAFLHDAELMLLDEPTSNLDSLNEAIILRALHEARGQKTIVLVSHRPSTMRIADTVYSVEQGRLS